MNARIKHISTAQSLSRQCGAALIVSMMMLIILTLIGVTSMRTTVMEERMTSNERNRSIAMHATESAMRDAERTILAYDQLLQFTNSSDPGTFGEADADLDFFDPSIWNDTNSIEATNKDHIASAGEAARTMARQVQRDINADGDKSFKNAGEGVSAGVTYFKITGRGVGGDTRSEVILQTYIGDRLE